MSAPLSSPTSTSQKPTRFKKCILHIGTEKTGTKVIQNYLQGNRKRLLKAGCLYPYAANTEHASQWEFVAAVQDSPWNQDTGRSFEISDDESQSAFRKHLRAKLVEEFLMEPSAETLLISCEHFQSRLHTLEQIQALKYFLAPWVETFEVIVYFRRQDRLALSFLSTRLKSSVNLNQAHMLAAMRSTPRYYDYLGIYNNWSKVFGRRAIKVRLYQPEVWAAGSIVSDFCHALNLPQPTEHIPTLNMSLDRKGFQFLRALNAHFPTTPGNTSDLERTALVRYISEKYAGKFYPISRQQAFEFYAEYRNRNERLRSLALPQHPKPLFDEDFSEYPEEAEDLEPDYGEAVEIAFDLWRAQATSNQSRPELRERLKAWLKGRKS